MQNEGRTKQLDPPISVIMSVYNGEQFLKEAIDSILCQTYRNFEFIICNDCSTDSSVGILRKYAEMDNRIVLLENETNIGLAASLNKCMAVARGAFLARMDCDDRSLPNRLEVQLEWLQRNPDVCALGTAVEYIDDNGRVFGRSALGSGKRYGLDGAVRRSVLVHPSVMMRKDAVFAVGCYSVNDLTTRAEDYDLWCKLCENGGMLANTNEILFQYREDESNIVKRKYVYRIQEFRLKWHWIIRARRPAAELIFAIKPLIVGLLPLRIYKVLHRANLSVKRCGFFNRR